MNTLEQQIKDFLIQTRLVSVWEEDVENTTEFIDAESDEDDIASTVSGIKYNKKIVFDFMKGNGYAITPENIEMVARKFNQEGRIIVKEKKKVLRSEIDNASLDLLEQLIPLKNLQVLEEINKKISMRSKYAYGLIEVPDLPDGTTDIKGILRNIEEYSAKGWRVKHVFENKNYSSGQGISPGSYQSMQQSIHGATVILLELKEYI